MPLGVVSHIRRITDLTLAINTANAQLNAELDDAVVEARAAGLSWAVIGMALGTTRQAAQQRFG